jgi:lipopolysaccharide export system protein LptA
MGTLAVAAVAVGMAPSGGHSQQEAALTEDVIDLSADGSIEWLRDKNVYVALGNARLRKKDQTYQAERLIAHYRKTPQGGTEVWRLELHQNVKVESPNATISGDDAAYESDSQVFVVTGRQPTMVTKNSTVSATDSIELWQGKDLAVARGNAQVVQKDRTIQADVIVSYFKKKGEGSESQSAASAADTSGSNLDRIEATGNVVIKRQDSVLRSNKAVYDPDTDMAYLVGNVRITRGDNQMNGEYAEFNLTSNVGKLTGGGSQRVHGLFSGGQ